ncbi:MAG: BNR-4 repeat-containing protein [Bacteroidetes bacterium]|nr:BNR-4 repeat-containing protein [Bacteroidota bacterium]
MFLALLVCAAGCGPHPDDPAYVNGSLIEFTYSTTQPNGAWCWFQDERAIVDADHPEGPMLLFTAMSASAVDSLEMGDLDLHFLGLDSGEQSSLELHDRFEQVDHNVAALHRLPDGRAMAVYAKHGSDRSIRTRISGQHDPRSWGEELLYQEEAGVTYSNLLTAGEERRLLNFSRSRGWNPNFVVWSDSAKSWSYGGRLLASEGRPYLKYRNTKDGKQIHVVATDQHPRDFDNSIHHGVTDGLALYDSFGQVVDADVSDQDGVAPSALSLVFRGDPDNVAWMADVEVDDQGQAVIAFSVQKDGRGRPPREGGLDHRYHLARFLEGQWVQHEVAYAGERLYPFEDDYTGLVAIDPQDVNRLVIATNAHPVTGEPLISNADGSRHYELFEGTSEDEGVTFEWEPLTANSLVDNIRPVIPSWDADRRVVLWMRGTYRSYTDWSSRIVGVVQDR